MQCNFLTAGLLEIISGFRNDTGSFVTLNVLADGEELSSPSAPSLHFGGRGRFRHLTLSLFEDRASSVRRDVCLPGRCVCFLRLFVLFCSAGGSRPERE